MKDECTFGGIVNNKSWMWTIALALLVQIGAASAGSVSRTLLYGTPTADVLPVGTMESSVDASFASTAGTWQWEQNAGLSLSPYRNLDVGVIAYTRADYVLDAKYRVLTSRSGCFGLAVGVCDLGLNGYVSPVGHGKAGVWPNWMYQQNGVSHRPYENASVFAVASYRATPTVRLHAGLGRGRFVGYGQRSRYFNSDILFREYHQWAVGLFGGAELLVAPQVALVGEMSGRDINAGIRASYSGITATVAWTKVDCLLFSMGSAGRLVVNMSYGFQHWSAVSGRFRQRRAAPSPAATEPSAGEHPAPDGSPACRDAVGLEPILFDWDSWQITRAAAASLSRSAAMLRSSPKATVVIIGYACEGGSPEASTMLSGKRALAVFEYLKVLGVPQRRMSFRAGAVTPGTPPPLRRAVCFDAGSRN
jgi:hypothetical protein